MDSLLPVTTRRELLSRAGGGFGILALADLLSRNALRAEPSAPRPASPMAPRAPRPASPMAPRAPHLGGRAKSVIFLFMYGGPSHVDLFDHKPALARYAGRPIADVVDTKGARSGGVVFPSPFEFHRAGESGHWVSDRYPHLAKVIDELAVIKSAYTDSISHAPALFQMNTGQTRTGFPSVGSWATYGLGSANDDLPGFVVLYDQKGGPIGGAPNWGAGFLPGAFQGTPVRSRGTPILDLAHPEGVSRERQRGLLDYAARLNREHLERHPEARELEARIQSFELAYRMQTAAPEALDIDRETAATRRLYGIESGQPTEYFGTQCLMARRLVERGVRFVQLYSGGGHGDDNWDAHGSIPANHGKHCAATDQPIAALITDLAQRGMLDDTLVVWGGEFGRTPHRQGGSGRDHHPFGMTVWMAGGGVRGGVSYGETDELGYHAAVNRASVHDLHATMLCLLGIDHERLTYRFAGRDFRLTEVAGSVIREIVA